MIQLRLKLFEHRAGEAVGAGLGHLLGEHLVELRLKHFLAAAAVEVRRFIDRAAHRLDHLTEESFADELIERFARLAGFDFVRGAAGLASSCITAVAGSNPNERTACARRRSASECSPDCGNADRADNPCR